MLWVKALVGAGLLALGYYVGRETGRAEGIRRDLQGRASAEPPGGEGPDAVVGAGPPARPGEPPER